MRIVVALVALLLGGCVSSAPLAFNVQVDNLGTIRTEQRSFVLLPGNDGVAAEDLQFQEYARYVGAALEARGFQPADGLATADLAFLVSYGIGDPVTHSWEETSPVYGLKEGEARVTSTTFGTDRYKTTTTTVNRPVTYGVVGSQTHTRSRTEYFRYLSLSAVDLERYRASAEVEERWRTRVTSTGSSGDLRRVMPILVAAAAPHLGNRTDGKLFVSLREDSPQVSAVRGEP